MQHSSSRVHFITVLHSTQRVQCRLIMHWKFTPCFFSFKECKVLDIQFHLLSGFPGETLPGFIKEWNMGAVVTDFWPLRDPTQWVDDVKKAISPDIPLIQVRYWHVYHIILYALHVVRLL